MILSDREIRAALDRGAVVIEPLPPVKAWSSTAVDLTLDRRPRAPTNPGARSGPNDPADFNDFNLTYIDPVLELFSSD
jgi:deoxycytidine triphosphate deaminase